MASEPMQVDVANPDPDVAGDSDSDAADDDFMVMEDNENVGPSAASAAGAAPREMDLSDPVGASAPERAAGASAANFHVNNANLDLEALVQGYSGLIRINRLVFMAKHCPPLRVEALCMAIGFIKQTYNTSLYIQIHRKLVEANQLELIQCFGSGPSLPDVTVPPPSLASSSSSTAVGAPVSTADNKNAASSTVPGIDQAWIEQMNKKAALKLEKLDTDLKNYKSNSIKESIRRGHDDLGDHFLDCGDLNNALRCYSRARDYCTSGRHVVNMCLNVIKVSVYLQNWSHVVSFVNKALSTPELAGADGANMKGKQNIFTRLNCAYGLAMLASCNYKTAAKHFLMASMDHCEVGDIMSAQNVATYGGLCALATFNRPELQEHIISSGSFKLFLELDPQLREILYTFYNSKYDKCLKLLEDIRDNLLLDLYLAKHVNILYKKIRNRGLVQYFSPYLSADLRLMASSFNTTVLLLEDELMTLILEGQIQARIDSYNKVLYAQNVDQRSATFERALEIGQESQKRNRLLILRSAFLKHSFAVRTSREGQQGHGQGQGQHGMVFN